MPCVAFAESLIAAYPDAKVVLTTRDVDAWHKSIMNTVVPAHRSLPLKILSRFDPDFIGIWFPMVCSMMDGYFGPKPLEEVGKSGFIKHYDKVRELVPNENLLEYKVGEGWGRLCEFLDQPIPKEEFPNTNDTKTFGERMGVIVQRSMVRALKRAAPLVALGVGAAALYFFKS